MFDGSMLDATGADAPKAHQYPDPLEYEGPYGADEMVEAPLLGVTDEKTGLYLVPADPQWMETTPYHVTTTRADSVLVWTEPSGTFTEAVPLGESEYGSAGEVIAATDWYELTAEGYIALATYVDFAIDRYPEFAEMDYVNASRRECREDPGTKRQLVGVLDNGIGIYYNPPAHRIESFAYDVDGDLNPIHTFVTDLGEYATVGSYFECITDDETMPNIKEQQPVPYPPAETRSG